MKSTFLRLKELNRKLRRWRKQKKLDITRWLYDKRHSTEPFDPAAIRKLLLLRWDNKIGDMVVCSFLFRELKKAHPDMEITVLAGPANRGIIARNPHVDDILVLKNKSAKEIRSVVNQVKRKDVDLIIDLSTGFPSRELKFLHQVGAKHAMGFMKDDFNIYDVNVGQHSEELHCVERYKEVLQQLGVTDIDSRYELNPDPKAVERVHRFMAEIPQQHVIAFNLYGSSVHRQFKAERAAALAEAMLAAFPSSALLLLYPPQKKDEVLAIGQRLNDKRVYVYPDVTSLDDTIALLDHSELIISPDTAIVHLAVALDRKVIGIYADNPTNFRQWHPNSKKARVIFNRATTREFERVNVGEFDDQDLLAAMKELDAMG